MYRPQYNCLFYYFVARSFQIQSKELDFFSGQTQKKMYIANTIKLHCIYLSLSAMSFYLPLLSDHDNCSDIKKIQ